MSIAASSARMSATFCAACADWRACTGRNRNCSSRRRRSQIPESSRRRSEESRRASSLSMPPSERGTVEGEVIDMAATETHELGIGMGVVEWDTSGGFPGPGAFLRKQWGRAGRGGKGLAVLVAAEDALGQYFMRTREALLQRRI